jgi:uncharacterized protein YggE
MRSKLFFLFPLLALAVALSACGPAVSSSSRTLTVSGNGVVYLTPDIAYLYVGVHTEDADIAEAVSRNNDRTEAVVEALKDMGVAAEDIQTSNFSVWSMEDYDDTGSRYMKYTVDNTIYITIRDLSKLGALLNTVVASGANNINSLSFDVADKTAALTEARQKAMENANALAEELAQTAGLKVGEVQNITYTDYYPSPYYGYGMGGGGAAPNESVPIQPGKLQISVTVNVTYEIGK